MKKPVFSRITTWAIRILCFLIFLIGACLLMLSTMGGTSDYHREGLQQAFSDSLDANVTIGALEEFNIIPQLSLTVEKMHGKFRNSNDEFLADKLHLAFGFADLMTGRKKIEAFQLNNLRFSADSRYDLRVDHAGLGSPANPALTAEGEFGRLPFALSVSLAGQTKNARNAYYFSDNNKLAGHYGILDFEGRIVPAQKKTSPVFEDINISLSGKKIARAYGIRSNGKLQIKIECTASPQSEVKVAFHKLKTVPFFDIAGNCL